MFWLSSMEPKKRIGRFPDSYQESILPLNYVGLEPLGVIETPPTLYERVARPSSYKGLVLTERFERSKNGSRPIMFAVTSGQRSQVQLLKMLHSILVPEKGVAPLRLSTHAFGACVSPISPHGR